MNAGAYARTFTKKPFKDRIKDTGYLIRHSFTIIGRDEDIKTPMIKMGIFTTILRIIFFLSLLTILTIESHENVGLIALTVLLWLIMVAILIPMRFFYDVRQKGNLCWVVYNTLCGKDISYRDAVGHTKSQKGRLKALGLGELVLVYSRTFKKDSGLLINLFLGFLTEVWDLLSRGKEAERDRPRSEKPQGKCSRHPCGGLRSRFRGGRGKTASGGALLPPCSPVDSRRLAPQLRDRRRGRQPLFRCLYHQLDSHLHHALFRRSGIWNRGQTR